MEINLEELKLFKNAFFCLLALSGVKGIVTQKVLLHCPCVNRNVRKTIIWQLEEHTIVLRHDGSNNHTTIGTRYENRASLFLNEEKDNCSLLLSGITVADHGTYKCSFTADAFVYEQVILHVAGKSFGLFVHSVIQSSDDFIVYFPFFST